MLQPKFVILITIFAVFSSLAEAKFHRTDKRPCGKAIDKCISKTRNSELGGCLGTAYGLYFAGEEGISYCKAGKWNAACLALDQANALNACSEYGPFPLECTEKIMDCIIDFRESKLNSESV